MAAYVDRDAATGLGASVTAAVPDGAYLLEVDGVGALDPATTGYSDYGSLGAYRVTSTGCEAPPATAPGAPGIGTAVAGLAGGAITATATWSAPASDGYSAVTGYLVTAQQLSSKGAVVATTVSPLQPAASRSLEMTLPVKAN